MDLTTEGRRCMASEFIKSEMKREGWVRLFGHLGEGLKEGREGIQEVGQIGRCEAVKTSRQAFVRRSGLL
jgi:hypothetical protein